MGAPGGGDPRLPRGERSRRHDAALAGAAHPLLELVSVHEHLALLVVVLQEARVLQQMVSLEQPLSQDELTAIGRHLNELARRQDGRARSER